MRNKIVIVDLDGTLADGNHRLHHLHPKEKRNWDAFYSKVGEDKPHRDVIELVNSLHACSHTVIILTGRREETRYETEAWLSLHSVCYDALIMRPVGNFTDDHKWKPDVIKQFGTHNILMVIEDRQRIVDTLREMGLRVVQVAPGNF